jgi:predicted DNA-binding transcriptional regulator AlpA
MVHLPEEKHFYIRELAQILGVGKRTIWRWVAKSILPEPVRYGPAVARFRESQAPEFIDKCSQRLGHSDPAVTLRTYADWIPKSEEALIAADERRFRAAKADLGRLATSDDHKTLENKAKMKKGDPRGSGSPLHGGQGPEHGGVERQPGEVAVPRAPAQFAVLASGGTGTRTV